MRPLSWWKPILFIILLLLLLGAYHWWFTGHVPGIKGGAQSCNQLKCIAMQNYFSTINHKSPFHHFFIGIIHSLEILINHLSDITNTALFCHCMKLDKNVCDKIEKENPGDLWKQTREMAAAWFNGHSEKPSWKEVFETFRCMKMNLLAQEIKDQTGCF